eukprot:TRINITY_DN1236_c0_g1_i1.p1 TRINITY_DN1236_c0_g1~~TRINITY_DN1236_c0_g1_i1.p1  ORF type:complete len:377 (-),score=117.63 TRINITY_DN1236_c0_g1_i1:39-1118(-)
MSVPMYETTAWAKKSAADKFEKITIKRNQAGDDDVTFDMKYCGICHTDVHFANNDMGSTKYPCVPGHELAGVVSAVGKNVTKFKVGDKVGVGCIVDTCMNCACCKDGDEHFCETGMTMTYDGDIKHGHIATDSGYTYGGYSASQTVNQRYLIKIPDTYPLEKAGPIFCAAITMYSPLCHWKVKEGGKKVGIIGIGGLGQMGVRIAKAMGNEVYAISTSPNKEESAKGAGADKFVVSTNPDSMKTAEGSLDLILNTVSASHQLAHYLPLLRKDGTLVQLGLVLTDHQVQQFPLMMKRISVAGSLIGGLPETQECMDFCAEHNIIPETKVIKADELETVYAALSQKNDSIVRYVLDITASM